MDAIKVDEVASVVDEPVAARTRSKVKRKLTEEQLTVLKERLVKARENKQKKREALGKTGTSTNKAPKPLKDASVRKQRAGKTKSCA